MRQIGEDRMNVLWTAAAAAAILSGCVSANPMPQAANANMRSTIAQRQAQNDNLNANMAMAQAQANRPGDDKLTCDQMQAEMTVMFQDPKFRGTIDAMGAQAQTQMAKAQGAGVAS